MRRLLFFLLTLLPFSTIAWAQTVAPPDPAQAMVIATSTPVNLEMVVTRLMSFDQDNDGLVARSELPERMQKFMIGDVTGDEALDRTEIQRLAAPLPAPTIRVSGFPPSGGYTFGDFGLSSRSHIEGALDDLRLAASTRDRALAIVTSFMDALEADASAVLMKELEALVAPERLTIFKAELNRQLSDREPGEMITRPDGIQVRLFLAKPSVARHINALHLPAWQTRVALDALERFKARVRPGDADRPALVAALKDVLGDEERESFGAALHRRPLVKAGGVAQISEFLRVAQPQ